MRKLFDDWKIWLIAAPAAFTAFALNTAIAYDEPAYRLIEENDVFEVREYEPYITAEVRVRDDFADAGNKAFRILFDYISGENIKQEAISMTIPVKQQRESKVGENIEMTAPVLQALDSGNHGVYRFSFVMPKEYSLDTLPRPKNPAITIRQISSHWAAVRRYSGSWSEQNYLENESVLLEALRDRELRVKGNPIYARYNSPFSLWFMRRNEVLVELDA